MDRGGVGGAGALEWQYYIGLFVAVVIAGALLTVWMRFAGLTRVTSGFNPPAPGTGAFYAFHPEEEMLIHAALTLNWDSPFDAPLTAFGLLPVYLARAVLAVEISFAKDDERRRIYMKIRSLAVLLSCALLVLVFLLGRNTIGERPALLAAVFVAYAPLVLQQAYFYTVDGVFAFCVLTFFAVLNHALAYPTWGRYLFVGNSGGSVCGGGLERYRVRTGATGHCASDGWQRLVDPQPWGAALMALAVFFSYSRICF